MATSTRHTDFKQFMERIEREVAALMLSGETGAITIHFNGSNGLRREINRRSEVVQVDAVELSTLRSQYTQN